MNPVRIALAITATMVATLACACAVEQIRHDHLCADQLGVPGDYARWDPEQGRCVALSEPMPPSLATKILSGVSVGKTSSFEIPASPGATSLVPQVPPPRIGAQPLGPSVGAAATNRAPMATTVTSTRIESWSSTPAGAASSPAPALDLTGTFSGTLSGSAHGVAFSTTIRFTMIENGQDLSAIFVTANGASGGIRGRTGTDEISGLSVDQTNPCRGTFEGAATIAENGSKLRGSYAGNDCKGEVDASFVVRRQ
jgi:hypothetical protein